MTQITGYANTLPTNYLAGPAVLYIDSATPYGVTVGGITINLPHEYENVSFDGKIIPIVGLDRRVGGVPSFEATLVEMTTAKALDLEPGGSSAGSSIVEITPKPYNEFLTSADYKENIRVAIRRGGATNAIFLVEFNWGMLLAESITTDDRTGMVKVRFEARQAADASSTGIAPYTIKMAADIATVYAPDT